jgi:hypothetical protein
MELKKHETTGKASKKIKRVWVEDRSPHDHCKRDDDEYDR